MVEGESLQEMRVGGMDCPSCASTIEAAVRRVPGVAACRVDIAGGLIRITGDADPGALRNAISAAGYSPGEPGARAEVLASRHTGGTGGLRGFLSWAWARPGPRLALVALPLAIPGLLLGELMGRESWWINAASLAAAVLAGVPVARAAWRALVAARRIDINVLMTVAAAGAVAIGAWGEAGALMVLFALGEALEGYTVGRATRAVRSLLEVQPDEATRLARAGGTVVHGGGEVVDIAALMAGDVVLVRPGGRLPADGKVLNGVSSIDEAMLTGEAMPVRRTAGDEVFAGTVNGDGALEVVVSAPAAASTVARIARLVAEAQAQRAPIERFVDRFAAVYTPLVILLAVAVAVLPPLLWGAPFLSAGALHQGWLYRALALLVVACPCALVISTPVAVVSAIGAGARQGVLIKGGAALERLGRTRAVAFDKTGTLTEGRPVVVGVHAVECVLDDTCALSPTVASMNGKQLHREKTNGSNAQACACDDAAGWCHCLACDQLLAYAGAVERRSEHPLARAVVDAATARGAAHRFGDAQAVTALAGRGVVGTVDGSAVTVASHRHFDEGMPHSAEQCAAARGDAARGLTPMLVAADERYLGRITVTDGLRESAPEAVAALQRRFGRDAVVMLTGDGQAAAARVARQVGIRPERVHPDMLPHEKLHAIAALRRDYGAVAMVGDGINDTPALAAADVGVAMGTARATAQALETADVALMGEDLRRLPWAFELGRAARATIRANIALAMGLKAAFLVLVIMGLSSMWLAVLADVGASLAVTLNGMRLARRGRSSEGAAA